MQTRTVSWIELNLKIFLFFMHMKWEATYSASQVQETHLTGLEAEKNEFFSWFFFFFVSLTFTWVKSLFPFLYLSNPLSHPFCEEISGQLFVKSAHNGSFSSFQKIRNLYNTTCRTKCNYKNTLYFKVHFFPNPSITNSRKWNSEGISLSSLFSVYIDFLTNSL